MSAGSVAPSPASAASGAAPPVAPAAQPPPPAQQQQQQQGGAGHPTYVSPSLYIGDLHPDVTEAMLFEVFNSVGPVTSIRVCRDSVTRRSLGYAYVNYQTLQDAERSLDSLNYTLIKGQPCRIMWSQRDPSLRKSGNGNIFVKNLDRSIDNKALYDTFSLFGNILSCKVGVDEQSRSKGYGFVHYESESSAKSAIEKVNGMLIGGKTVFVGPFLTRNERDSSGDVRFTNVYVKNLPTVWASEEAFKPIVEPFGEITSLVVRSDARGRVFAFCNFAQHTDAEACVAALNGRRVGSKGFKEENQQEQQAEDPDDQVLFAGPHQSKAQRSAVLRARYEQLQQEKGERYQGVNLYIKNVDDSLDDEKVRELFEAFGPTSSVKIMRDERGVSRGFGFVCFVNAEDATKAVAEMHLKYVKGKPLYVGLAERREQRLQRLQQRFRLPALRPMAAVGGLPAGVAAPPVAYGSAAALAGIGGFPGRPLMGYAPQTQMPLMPWRQQQQHAAFAQQQQAMGLRPSINPLQQIYAPQNAAAAVALQQQLQQQQLQQQQQQQTPQPRGGGGHRAGRGSALNAKQQPQQQMLKQQQQQQMHGDGSFKFTPQVRNQRLEQQQQQQQQQQPIDAPHLLLNPDAPLTAAALAAAQPSMQKQMLGERLFPLIARHQPELAGKITGMMLEMDNSELLILLESDGQLKGKVEEALRVLRSAN